MPITVSRVELAQIPSSLLPKKTRRLICDSHLITPVIYSNDPGSRECIIVTDVICRGECKKRRCALKKVTQV